MQHLEVSGAVRHIYRSAAKQLSVLDFIIILIIIMTILFQ